MEHDISNLPHQLRHHHELRILLLYQGALLRHQEALLPGKQQDQQGDHGRPPLYLRSQQQQCQQPASHKPVEIQATYYPHRTNAETPIASVRGDVEIPIAGDAQRLQ